MEQEIKEKKTNKKTKAKSCSQKIKQSFTLLGRHKALLRNR